MSVMVRKMLAEDELYSFFGEGCRFPVIDQ